MNAHEYEKSLDNRRAALVSRGRGAPRAKIGRKSFAFNALGLTRARGSNATRSGARRAKSAYFVRGSSGSAKMPLNGRIYDPPTRIAVN